MTVNDRSIENIVVTYEFHAFDAHDNDQYFFKIENTNSLKQVNDFFKNHCDVNLKFLYRKNNATYVKIKHEDIDDFFNIKFEKRREYIANLHMIYFQTVDEKGYYPKITLIGYDLDTDVED